MGRSPHTVGPGANAAVLGDLRFPDLFPPCQHLDNCSHLSKRPAPHPKFTFHLPLVKTLEFIEHKKNAQRFLKFGGADRERGKIIVLSQCTG